MLDVRNYIQENSCESIPYEHSIYFQGGAIVRNWLMLAYTLRSTNLWNSKNTMLQPIHYFLCFCNKKNRIKVHWFSANYMRLWTHKLYGKTWNKLTPRAPNPCCRYANEIPQQTQHNSWKRQARVKSLYLHAQHIKKWSAMLKVT